MGADCSPVLPSLPSWHLRWGEVVVIVDQVMDNMVNEGADEKAKDITEVGDEGTNMWVWWCVTHADGRGDGSGGGHGDGDGQES